jgi:hypothetical protein
MTPQQTETLRIVADMIVPPSTEYGVPGAGDPLIQADILATLGRDAAHVEQALDLATTFADGPLSALDKPARDALSARLQAEGGAPVATLARVVLGCYYRDDRVLKSLGQEARAPFPKGYELEQGDWSLLEPVKAMKPFWRQVD